MWLITVSISASEIIKFKNENGQHPDLRVLPIGFLVNLRIDSGI